MSSQLADNLTIAYIAQGAFEAIREMRRSEEGRRQEERAIDRYQGQMGLIDAVIDYADALELAYVARPGELSGVFLYECAEPFGAELCRRLIAQVDPKPVELAEELIREACR